MNIRYQGKLNRAKTLTDQNRFDPAQSLYEEILAEDPNQPDALSGLAHLDEAKLAFQQGAGQIAIIQKPLQETVSFPPPVKPSTNNGTISVPSETTINEAELGLRCNRCNKPITLANAKHTSVGYRCTDCIRELEDTKYFSATLVDNLIASGVCLLAGIATSTIIGFLNFLSIFLGAAVGSLIGSSIFRLINKRRGRYLPLFAVICFLATSLPTLFFFTSGGINSRSFMFGLLGLCFGASTIYARLKG